MAQSPQGDHSFGKEALKTNMELLWNRPGPSLNMSSANLWDGGKKKMNVPFFPIKGLSCSPSPFSLHRRAIRFKVRHLGVCASFPGPPRETSS